jgi:hypothetical protein
MSPRAAAAARQPRIHTGLRLRRGQDRLGLRGAAAGGRERKPDPRRGSRPHRCPGVPSGRPATRRVRSARRQRLGHLFRPRRARCRPRPPRAARDPCPGGCSSRGRDDSGAEHDQAERPAWRHRRADAQAESDEPSRYDVRRPVRRAADPSGRRRSPSSIRDLTRAAESPRHRTRASCSACPPRLPRAGVRHRPRPPGPLVDVLGLLGHVGDALLRRAFHLPHRGRGLGDQDQEHPRPGDRMGGQGTARRCGARAPQPCRRSPVPRWPHPTP